MTPVQKILLALGIIGLLKGIWGIAHPVSFKKVVAALAKGIRYVPTFYGLGLAALGIVFWIVILVGLPVSNWLLAFFGFLTVWAGVTAIHRGGVDFITEPLVTRRNSLVIRLVSIAGLIVSIAIIWVAVARWS